MKEGIPSIEPLSKPPITDATGVFETGLDSVAGLPALQVSSSPWLSSICCFWKSEAAKHFHDWLEGWEEWGVAIDQTLRVLSKPLVFGAADSLKTLLDLVAAPSASSVSSSL